MRPIVVATAALAVVLLTGVALVGDLWGRANAEGVRHLIAIQQGLFFAFQANLIVLVIAYAFFTRLGRLVWAVNVYGVVIFGAGFVKAGFHFDRLLHSVPGAPPLQSFVPSGMEPFGLLQFAMMLVLIVWIVISLVRRR